MAMAEIARAMSTVLGKAYVQYCALDFSLLRSDISNVEASAESGSNKSSVKRCSHRTDVEKRRLHKLHAF